MAIQKTNEPEHDTDILNEESMLSEGCPHHDPIFPSTDEMLAGIYD